MKCPVPGCEAPLSGRHSAFCAEHHMAADLATARQIIRFKIELDRARSEEVREHVEERITFLTRKCIAAMQKESAE